MAVLTKAEHDEVAEAIRTAERRTAGEIFAVAAAASDSYRFIPLMWAALATLLAGITASFLYPVLEGFIAAPQAGEWLAQAPEVFGPGLDARTVAAAEIVLFIVLAILASLGPIRPLLVPGFIRRQRAERHAMQQFLAHNLHGTDGRTGILIFVSLAERYAAVIADEGINEKVGQAVWDGLIEKLTEDIRAGNLGPGLVSAIAGCGEILAEHVPAGTRNPNELPDKLVEV
ncbi:TPM domain-containing protein [Afifella sp. IM 167]|uniref:TPM domain-containing protein n=1 Tax=Afifella sp. IM 167 TaxID=2033586 RepID=UPI001CCAB6A3|nr:TPM domain-containing protein [Afifella sp. IM 167]MBZ8134929.1 hypothetical protein [Afifella sp. IM 167]